ncbi:hypothetical protein Micbo1qcDRAFT_165094 [Microdochium bolleyi]|uniref:Uncharacterized protein n=1 Tax=Microdochium bolleyi TaxID=196109 RepID=A0A136IXV0_9PEZI|nr:hypothetical protein Micbo1qcDRAFT_165094 [Microdochium bolleyi]
MSSSHHSHHHEGGGGKDLRISRQLERTGMEYLVVRRYQNPIARSITRLSHLPGANKTQQIRLPKSNGAPNGAGHAKKPSYGLSQSLTTDSQQQQQQQKSRPVTPGGATAASAASGRQRPTSIRTNGGANANFGNNHGNGNGTGTSNNNNNNDDDNDDGAAGVHDDGGLAAILRNLWDKNMDLSASQD